MKKTIFWMWIFVLATSLVFADSRGNGTTTQATSSAGNSFYLGFGCGADLPGTNWGPNYTLGGGGQALAGYNLDNNWAVQLDIENWFFEGIAYSLYNLRTLALIKYTFSVAGWQPYLLAGTGSIVQSLSTTGSSSMNLDALGGLGIQFDLSSDTHFFVEAKYNFILPSTGSFQDVPISTGLWVNLL